MKWYPTELWGFNLADKLIQLDLDNNKAEKSQPWFLQPSVLRDTALSLCACCYWKISLWSVIVTKKET